MYSAIEYSDNYSKTSRILWEYCNDEPVVANNVDITDFNADNITSLFDLKEKKPYQKLKYLSNFWRTLEMSLINCQINLVLK